MIAAIAVFCPHPKVCEKATGSVGFLVCATERSTLWAFLQINQVNLSDTGYQLSVRSLRMHTVGCFDVGHGGAGCLLKSMTSHAKGHYIL